MCDNEDVDQPVTNQTTDTSVDKAEDRIIYILIYAFKHNNRHMLLKAKTCSIFIAHPLLISIFACINDRT